MVAQFSRRTIKIDGGFDLWLVNSHVMKYNTMHTSLNPNDTVLMI